MRGRVNDVTADRIGGRQRPHQFVKIVKHNLSINLCVTHEFIRETGFREQRKMG